MENLPESQRAEFRALLEEVQFPHAFIQNFNPRF
jgi:hypothetical protein